MNKKFLIGILALLLLVFLFEYRMPRHFVWEPTYSHRDPQPFGCMVFDSVLAASMPQGYTVTRQTLWQMQHDSLFMAQRHGIVLLVGDNYLGETVVKQLFQMAEAGNIVLVATMGYELDDTLGISIYWNDHFTPSLLATNSLKRGRLRCFSEGDYLKTQLTVFSQLVSRTFRTYTVEEADSDQTPTKPHTPLAAYQNFDESAYSYIAATFPVGDGELILLTAPLLMTNYGVLDDEIRVVIGRLMNRMRHLPVVRTEAYVSGTAQTEESPFYVLLQRPPLRWAVYLTMLTLLLLMFFTARRRQRVIPVVTPPKNGNLEFVKLIGTLYRQEGDHRGLVSKKLLYAAEEIRRLTGLDILQSPSSQEGAGEVRDARAAQAAKETARQLSRLTGIAADELSYILNNVREATSGRHVVDEHEMKAHIESLNNILGKLT